jgi:hypothetical protein
MWGMQILQEQISALLTPSPTSQSASHEAVTEAVRLPGWWSQSRAGSRGRKQRKEALQSSRLVRLSLTARRISHSTQGARTSYTRQDYGWPAGERGLEIDNSAENKLSVWIRIGHDMYGDQCEKPGERVVNYRCILGHAFIFPKHNRVSKPKILKLIRVL